MAALVKRFVSYWFAHDAVANTQALVRERTESLTENTRIIDEIAILKEKMLRCFNAIKAENASLEKILKDPSPEPIDAQEIGSLLKIVALATMTDLSGLDQDFEEVRKKREKLEEFLITWEKLEAIYDAAKVKVEKTLTLDEKNIQNLTEIRVMVQNTGLPPTCHTDSTL